MENLPFLVNYLLACIMENNYRLVLDYSSRTGALYVCVYVDEKLFCVLSWTDIETLEYIAENHPQEDIIDFLNSIYNTINNKL